MSHKTQVSMEKIALQKWLQLVFYYNTHSNKCHIWLFMRLLCNLLPWQLSIANLSSQQLRLHSSYSYQWRIQAHSAWTKKKCSDLANFSPFNTDRWDRQVHIISLTFQYHKVQCKPNKKAQYKQICRQSDCTAQMTRNKQEWSYFH